MYIQRHREGERETRKTDNTKRTGNLEQPLRPQAYFANNDISRRTHIFVIGLCSSKPFTLHCLSTTSSADHLLSPIIYSISCAIFSVPVISSLAVISFHKFAFCKSSPLSFSLSPDVSPLLTPSAHSRTLSLLFILPSPPPPLAQTTTGSTP